MDRYLTVTHAGVRLDLSPFRITQLFDRGDLRGIRDSNGRRLISEESVEELRARRRAAPSARNVRDTGIRQIASDAPGKIARIVWHTKHRTAEELQRA